MLPLESLVRVALTFVSALRGDRRSGEAMLEDL